ncbi:MAG: sulfatase-like hydrolase/transferase [Acidimicrobiales bacterium]
MHGVTQTDGLAKMANDSRMRWLRAGEVPTLGHWFRWAGYDTHYDGKWHLSHADLHDDHGVRCRLERRRRERARRWGRPVPDCQSA